MDQSHHHYSHIKNRKGSYIGSDHTVESSNYHKHSSRKCSETLSETFSKHKTQICQYWRNSQVCPFGQECNFAHGHLELRAKDTLSEKYKTKPCHNFTKNGFCMYGSRCQFVHNPPTSHIDTFSKIMACHYWFPEEQGLIRVLTLSKNGSRVDSCSPLLNSLPEGPQYLKNPELTPGSLLNIYPDEEIYSIYGYQSGSKPRLYSL